jgi:type VI secretion system protein ImpH
MQATQRRLEPGVIQRLLDEPHRFAFAQAVRVLLIWLRQHDVENEAALGRLLRFQNSVSLAFPAAQIEALEVHADTTIRSDTALLAALREGRLRHVRLSATFMGLLGNHGVLPFHYTERIARQLYRQKSDSARALLDIFASRLHALYFQAWAKYRLESTLDVRGKDAFLPTLTALAGVRERAGADAGIDIRVAAYYAGLLRQRPVSACAIEQVLADYFGIPIRIEQCVGGWDYTAERELSRLGVSNCTLALGCALGVRKWRHDLIACLHIGPLDREDFERFLRQASAAAALEKLLGLFGVVGVRYQAQLILRARCVQPLVLGAGRRLGVDVFLQTKPETRDRSCVRYHLQPS